MCEKKLLFKDMAKMALANLKLTKRILSFVIFDTLVSSIELGSRLRLFFKNYFVCSTHPYANILTQKVQEAAA